ncbi:MAG: YicC/YloC family endoribonuclease [Bacteroidota bacterium]
MLKQRTASVHNSDTMIYSMTGYGKSLCEINNKKITLEIKSLNSKQLDLSTRIPGFYKEKEIEIRSIIAKELGRGKIDFALYAELSGEDSNPILNTSLMRSYHKQLLDLTDELKLPPSDLLQVLIRMPDVIKNDREDLKENEWQAISDHIQKAIVEVKNFRKQEGAAMEKDMINHIDAIEKYLEELSGPETERIETIKNRIRNNLNEFCDREQIDKNRFEQEIIYYIEKLDISEEKVRLKNHCKYFRESIREKDPVGKKLGFITQEIGREINTIGSKANDSSIQMIVVRMKDELEKIKEQSLNVL